MNYNTLHLMAKPLCSLWCISTSDINTGFDTVDCIKLLIINIIIYKKMVLFKNYNYVPILFILLVSIAVVLNHLNQFITI